MKYNFYKPTFRPSRGQARALEFIGDVLYGVMWIVSIGLIALYFWGGQTEAKSFLLYAPQEQELTFAPEASIDTINPLMGEEINIVRFLEKYEGYRRCAYPDGNYWSIGYGSRALSAMECIDKKSADKRLRYIVNDLVDQAETSFPDLNHNQRMMLVSFKFNVRPNHSDYVWNMMARKEYVTAMNYWQSIIMKGTNLEAGLIKRRNAELLPFKL